MNYEREYQNTLAQIEELRQIAKDAFEDNRLGIMTAFMEQNEYPYTLLSGESEARDSYAIRLYFKEAIIYKMMYLWDSLRYYAEGHIRDLS